MTTGKDQEFMSALHMYIAYWNEQQLSCKEKLEGLCHSILVILDGMSASFHGDISDLIDENRMLHDGFYEFKKQRKRNGYSL